ncbi:MAG: WxcM-like domain-containing protein [Sediminibacterium sp. Gen4]|jgi:dTDP-4-dehydrorhamnose 3,5-epimerase-like enzyme|uniref:sugar 3,4-ketoisomerase n=1 Tax=unclassified Sediminibacterium TaxID=2635961 RepID=UPI0015B7A509|nr:MULTISPECIES: FdtA/QdtA family cupin domain-containing protein [unclassified Sediminibacterium]MBW0161198.1 FdtA/QdtA family cupin domain-containing protein [Sediminibacterium sp.]MBW0163724.1 FdtA/QdtA family cupin domain-containing protein [Sediminibacterium sp.]NWK66926.1 WxcM-like domain-containing protein [Sediminibacterium sp. Gen4]
MASSVYDCSVLPLSKIHNRAGNITVIEGDHSVPFPIKRIYYLYDIPSGETRGGHGHKELYQLIVAASGSFDVVLDDGRNKRIVTLNRPDYGLMVVPGIWRELLEFSSGAICLVMASEIYTELDYIREYKDFIAYKNA